MSDTSSDDTNSELEMDVDSSDKEEDEDENDFPLIGDDGNFTVGGLARFDTPRGRKIISAIQRDIMKRPGVRFDDIIGHREIKRLIQPRSRQFTDSTFDPRRKINAILLFGPPGTGKTMFAEAFGSIDGVNFFNVPSSFLLDASAGLKVDALFACAQALGGVIFFDEIDQMFKNSTSKLTALQLALNNNYSNLIVIGATNYPQRLSDALLSRFDELFFVPSCNAGTIS